MSVLPTPILREADADKNKYRGFAMAQLAILREQMRLGGLKIGNRIVSAPDGAVITCSICFNKEDVYVQVPRVVGAPEELGVHALFLVSSSYIYGAGLGATNYSALSLNGQGWIPVTTVPFVSVFLAASRSLFAAVDIGGYTYALSGDGVHWVQYTSPLISRIYASGGIFIRCNNDRTYALGEPVTELQMSRDGISWVAMPGYTSIPDWDLNAYGMADNRKGTFVISLYGPHFLVSTDAGNSWSAVSNPSGFTGIFGDVVYAFGKFYVILVDTVGQPHGIAESVDGVVWSRILTVTGTSTLRSFAFGDGALVLVGASVALRTTDGTTFTSHTMPTGNYKKVVYGAGVFMSVGLLGELASSRNGSDWVAEPPNMAHGCLDIAVLA